MRRLRDRALLPTLWFERSLSMLLSLALHTFLALLSHRFPQLEGHATRSGIVSGNLPSSPTDTNANAASEPCSRLRLFELTFLSEVSELKKEGQADQDDDQKLSKRAERKLGDREEIREPDDTCAKTSDNENKERHAQRSKRL